MARTATKKEPLQEAALRLFVQKGIAGTTTKEIAESAGIAEGTIYRHYPSKDALAWDLFSRNFIQLAQDLDRIQAQEPNIKQKTEHLVNHFLSLFDKDPELFSYLLLSQHDLLKRVTHEMPNPTTIIINIIKDSIRKGEISPKNPELLAGMVMGIVLQTAIFHIYGRINGKLTHLTKDISEACLKVLDK